jgi:N-formylglutamate deformylase
METYAVAVPTSPCLPILLSIPHCGTDFPPEIRQEFKPGLIGSPDDTDWFVDRLYDFAPSIGITMISARLSRWVIDLNRNPDNKPLYTDGRIITDLCPSTTFLGEPLYKDDRNKVDAEEIERRKELYFNPYHDQLAKLLAGIKSEFGKVLLWDCHSIRQRVLTIQNDVFPDMILGSADGHSASESLTNSALHSLASEKYRVQRDDPFKGGFITRHFGKPEQRQHALQLEMTKINYMDDTERQYDPPRAKKMAELLLGTLEILGKVLISMKD